MKSDDRIIELLAEYLKKTDQLLDRMDRTDKSVEIMSRALAEDSIKFNQMNEKFNLMNEKFDIVNQDIKTMLGELISLSKRVSVLEK
jgi:uncharacterized membrane protein